jgi:hypothetical protein
VQDYQFSGIAAAAYVVLGRSANGKKRGHCLIVEHTKNAADWIQIIEV